MFLKDMTYIVTLNNNNIWHMIIKQGRHTIAIVRRNNEKIKVIKLVAISKYNNKVSNKECYEKNVN